MKVLRLRKIICRGEQENKSINAKTLFIRKPPAHFDVDVLIKCHIKKVLLLASATVYKTFLDIFECNFRSALSLCAFKSEHNNDF